MSSDEPKLDAVGVDHALLAAQQDAFNELGYVLIPGAIPGAKVTALRHAIETIRSKLESHPHRSRVENGLNIRPIIDKHPVFKDLLIWPHTFAAVAKLLGHYSIQLQQSNLIEAYPSNRQRLTGWHSDGGIPSIAVNGVRAFSSLKVAYFLSDLSQPDMGNLMVVPRSHRMQGSPPFPPGQTDPAGATQIIANAGDALIFQQGIWHAAAPNYSQQNRVALYYGYSYRVLRPVDYQRMPQALLDTCSLVERQLLGETITHQGYYVPTDADVPLRPWFTKHFGDIADRGELERVTNTSLS
jgi:ectoine hydroxylase-related dioxygenase (phytanoyl-CoA dioxygenase family)